MRSIRIAVIFAALITTACSGGPVSPAAPSLSSPAANASSVPTATASPTPLVSATAVATPSALPEGTYQTAPIPTATLKATAEAAGFTWDPTRWTQATTVYAIRLTRGRLLWFCSSDGGTADLCSRGTYIITDDRTVTYTDAEDGSGFVLTFTLDGDVLTTHVDPGPGAGIEAIVFFNSAPFVLQP